MNLCFWTVVSSKLSQSLTFTFCEYVSKDPAKKLDQCCFSALFFSDSFFFVCLSKESRLSFFLQSLLFVICYYLAFSFKFLFCLFCLSFFFYFFFTFFFSLFKSRLFVIFIFMSVLINFFNFSHSVHFFSFFLFSFSFTPMNKNICLTVV